MTPIISPWLIWIIGSLTAIKLICCIIATIAIFMVIVTRAISIVCKDDVSDTTYSTCKKLGKWGLVLSVVCLFVAVFLPTKETAEKMIIASYITEDNVDLVVEKAKEAIDYIYDKIEGVENN